MFALRVSAVGFGAWRSGRPSKFQLEKGQATSRAGTCADVGGSLSWRRGPRLAHFRAEGEVPTRVQVLLGRHYSVGGRRVFGQRILEEIAVVAYGSPLAKSVGGSAAVHLLTNKNHRAVLRAVVDVERRQVGVADVALRRATPAAARGVPEDVRVCCWGNATV